MPVKTDLTVKARDVKVNDFVKGYGPVMARDPKVKWITLFFDPVNSLKLRTELDSDVEVTREVPTKEETRAKELMHALRALDWREDKDRKALAAARDKMRTDMEKGIRADHWHWMDVPEAQALVELWDAVAHVHRVQAEKDAPITRIEAVKLILDAETKKALSYYRALSRSTSVVSNLFDDIKIAAISAWQRELEWILIED